MQRGEKYSPWEINENVSVQYNPDGFAAIISHVLYPFQAPSEPDNEYGLAVAYLRVVKDLLGIADAAIDHLEKSIPPAGQEHAVPDPLHGPQLRWRTHNPLRDELIVLNIQQTHDGAEAAPDGSSGPTFVRADVEKSGIRIVVHRASGGTGHYITGATSSLRRTFNFDPDAGDVPLEVAEQRHIDSALLNPVLGRFGFGPFLEADLEFRFVRLIHRFDPAGAPSNPSHGPTDDGADPQPGVDYVGRLLRLVPASAGQAFVGDGSVSSAGFDTPPYEIIWRERDGAPLAATVLLSHAGPQNGSGLVFEVDPITATADFALRPNATDAALAGRQQRVPFLLDPPSGLPPRWRLSGPNVRVVGEPGTPFPCGGIGVAPPTLPATQVPPRFDFMSRTNEFAAVNAYAHCDAMFGMLDLFGLPFVQFPGAYALPAQVVHRGAIIPGACSNGNCINAQLRIIPRQTGAVSTPLTCDNAQGSEPQVQFRFALADLMLNPGSVAYPLSPLGIACDVRIVWHEFCHAMIAAGTDQLEFPFAHSAGDALAAINCDPESKLAEPPWADRYRGVTFPWTAFAARRHDRLAAEGWSWSGPLGTIDGYHTDLRDRNGYSREQVLSSTLFRLYRSIDGDAADLARRQAAAEYVTYLIAYAIASLGKVVPAADADAFADALMQADIATVALVTPIQTDIAPMGRIGGTVNKVIRWAFEKQGLYAPPGGSTLPDGAGDPPPVDVFIDDGRAGEYGYTAAWQNPVAVWNRHMPDNGTVDEPPVSGADNYIYVVVSNRGAATATNASVSVYFAAASVVPVWPDTAAWTNALLAAGGTGVASVPGRSSGSPPPTVTFGPYAWRPAKPGGQMVLTAVDAVGDRSNIDPASLASCALLAGLIEYLVPLDNNLGLSNWVAT